MISNLEMCCINKNRTTWAKEENQFYSDKLKGIASTESEINMKYVVCGIIMNLYKRLSTKYRELGLMCKKLSKGKFEGSERWADITSP